MPVNLTAKIVALVDSLTDADIESLRPAERRRLAASCRHVAAVAERAEQKGGVLADLRRGQRGES
jgi:hypothetical protein